MLYEVYHRICVGAPLEVAEARGLVARFHVSLGLAANASLEMVHARLRDDLKRHELNTDDRVLYERAFEAFVDELWDVDCAIGGVSEGAIDPAKGYVFVGVRVEQFDLTVHDDEPRLAQRPTWLHKGDLSPGSDFGRTFGPDARTAVEHAGRSWTRAGKMIVGDATTRLKLLPVSKQREVGWALVRWLVPARR